MRVLKSSVFWGVVLIIAGGLLLLEALSVLATAFIWPVIFGAAGVAFLYAPFKSRDVYWWAAIPGFALVRPPWLGSRDRVGPPTAKKRPVGWPGCYRRLASATCEAILPAALNAWHAAKLGVETTPAIDVPTLAERLKNEDVVLLDVREDEEWRAGHVAGSIQAPYRTLRDGVPEEIEDVDKPLAVACSGGIRSSLAASLLKRAGIEDVEYVADGGVPMLSKEGIELVEGE